MVFPSSYIFPMYIQFFSYIFTGCLSSNEKFNMFPVQAINVFVTVKSPVHYHMYSFKSKIPNISSRLFTVLEFRIFVWRFSYSLKKCSLCSLLMEANNSLLFWEEMAAPYGRKKLCDVREMTENEFFVRGCTALLDAMEKLCIQCG